MCTVKFYISCLFEFIFTGLTTKTLYHFVLQYFTIKICCCRVSFTFKKWSYQRHNIKISFLVQLFLLNAWLIMTLCLLIGCGKLFFSVLRGGLHVSKNLCHLNLLISARIYQAYRSHNKDEVARPSCKTSLQGMFFTAFLFNLNLLHSHLAK